LIFDTVAHDPSEKIPFYSGKFPRCPALKASKDWAHTGRHRV
jgi:hypothetical protein